MSGGEVGPQKVQRGHSICPGHWGPTHTLMFSLVMRGQATFSFHFLIKQVMERSERFSRESCQEISPSGQCLLDSSLQSAADTHRMRALPHSAWESHTTSEAGNFWPRLALCNPCLVLSFLRHLGDGQHSSLSAVVKTEWAEFNSEPDTGSRTDCWGEASPWS